MWISKRYFTVVFLFSRVILQVMGSTQGIYFLIIIGDQMNNTPDRRKMAGTIERPLRRVKTPKADQYSVTIRRNTDPFGTGLTYRLYERRKSGKGWQLVKVGNVSISQVIRPIRDRFRAWLMSSEQ